MGDGVYLKTLDESLVLFLLLPERRQDYVVICNMKPQRVSSQQPSLQVVIATVVTLWPYLQLLWQAPLRRTGWAQIGRVLPGAMGPASEHQAFNIPNSF
jgi:hypothetical protein